MSAIRRSVTANRRRGEKDHISASQYRGQLERKRKQRVDAENRAAAYRTKESKKRAEAAKARQAAAKTRSEATARTKLREPNRGVKEAETAGKEAGHWQTKAAGYARDEAAQLSKLTRAEQSEADAAQRRRKREQQQADRRAAADRLPWSRGLPGRKQWSIRCLGCCPHPSRRSCTCLFSVVRRGPAGRARTEADSCRRRVSAAPRSD